MIDDMQVKYQRSNITQRSIYFTAPKLFNELPSDIKNISEFLRFKRKVKAQLISAYINRAKVPSVLLCAFALPVASGIVVLFHTVFIGTHVWAVFCSSSSQLVFEIENIIEKILSLTLSI